jgi:hypothetical protein
VETVVEIAVDSELAVTVESVVADLVTKVKEKTSLLLRH